MATKFQDTHELKVSSTDIENLKKGKFIKSTERPIIGSKGLLWHIRVKPYVGGIINDFVTNPSHYAKDVTILIGDESLEVHRHLLFMISPVFQAEFEHDTEEAKTGKIKITDFEFATVKNVVDYCYGRECEAKTTLDFVNMLRFADKYDIRTVIKLIEQLIIRDLSNASFCPVAEYAWDCERKELQSKCAFFYKENIASVGLSQHFINMNPSTQVGLIHALGPLCNANVDNALNQNEQTYSLIEKPTALSFTTDSDHYPPDARIVVGEQSIDIHRQYLSMISPVFYEKFNGDTKEKPTGAIEIADFNFGLVKLVIDCCYSQQVNYDEALSNVFDILRFGHTYGIQQIIDRVELFLLADLSADNFCSIQRC